jgi:hypothetical protein
MRISWLLVGLLWTTPMLAKTPDAKSLAATQGYVYASFPKISQGLLSVEAVAGGRQYELVERSDSKRKAQGLWLPEGDYRISRWGPHVWAPAQDFHVQAGRVTDLGSLLAIGIGDREQVLVSLHPTEEAHAVDAALDEFAEALVSREPIAWNAPLPSRPLKGGSAGTAASAIPSLAAARTVDELLRGARAFTAPMYDEPAIAADGTMYYGADFGQLRVRGPAGQWSNVGMDTLHAIPAVEWVDGALVTGADDGALRRSTDGGKTWAQLRKLDGEKIIDIDQANGLWLVTTSQVTLNRRGFIALDRIRVYKATAADLSDLAVLRDFPLDPNAVSNYLAARPQLVKGKFFLTLPDQLVRLDLASMQWKTLTPPGKVSMAGMEPTTGVLTAFLSKGAFSKVYVSEDGGDSWVQTGRPPYVILDVQFETRDSGWANRMNMNAISVDWEVYRYDRALDDWKKISTSPRNCRISRASAATPTFCFASDAIYRLGAAGWEAEFPGTAP